MFSFPGLACKIDSILIVLIFFKATDPNAEEAANDPSSKFKSGGGFSNYFPRPSWQETVVQNYIDSYTGNLSASVFDRSGRAYPDVSSNGFVSRT